MKAMHELYRIKTIPDIIKSCKPQWEPFEVKGSPQPKELSPSKAGGRPVPPASEGDIKEQIQKVLEDKGDTMNKRDRNHLLKKLKRKAKKLGKKEGSRKDTRKQSVVPGDSEEEAPEQPLKAEEGPRPEAEEAGIM